MQRSAASMIPRLAAEFFVIVVGVLVALGVDSWAAERADRVLEREYLQRLLDDVQYDLRELDFIDAIGRAGLDASTTLSSPEAVADLTPSLLVATVSVAAAERRPDLSRSTYRELLSSGRIDLIQAADVRVALANYDRRIIETEAVWENLSPKLRAWAWSRIPNAVHGRFVEACSVDASDPTFSIRTVCEFDLGGWSAGGLRQDVMSIDAGQKMLLAGHRFRTGLEVSGQLRLLATELAEAIARELSDA